MDQTDIWGKKESFWSLLLSSWKGSDPACAWGDTLHGLTIAGDCLSLKVCLWASFNGLDHSGSFQWHPPKWGLSSRKATSLTEQENGDVDCWDFIQLNRAGCQERLLEQDTCAALNKNDLRCCNSSLQLLQNYCRLFSTVTVGHSIRK